MSSLFPSLPLFLLILPHSSSPSSSLIPLTSSYSLHLPSYILPALSFSSSSLLPLFSIPSLPFFYLFTISSLLCSFLSFMPYPLIPSSILSHFSFLFPFSYNFPLILSFPSFFLSSVLHCSLLTQIFSFYLLPYFPSSILFPPPSTCLFHPTSLLSFLFSPPCSSCLSPLTPSVFFPDNSSFLSYSLCFPNTSSYILFHLSCFSLLSPLPSSLLF